MSTARETYQVTLHPGKRPALAAARLAVAIINRWMPGNAGGVQAIMGPQLAKALLPSYEKANATNKNRTLTIDTRGSRPVITDPT